MSFDWLIRAWEHLDKLWLALGLGAASAVGFQRIRKAYRAEQVDAVTQESKLDVIQALRSELEALQIQNAAIMAQFLALQREHLSVRTQLSELTVQYRGLKKMLTENQHGGQDGQSSHQ